MRISSECTCNSRHLQGEPGLCSFCRDKHYEGYWYHPLNKDIPNTKSIKQVEFQYTGEMRDWEDG